MMYQFWRDDSAVVLSTELVLLMTILVIGLVTGMTALKSAVIVKLADVAGAVGALDPSYGFTGTTYATQNLSAFGTDSTAYTNGTEYQSDAASNLGEDMFGVGGLSVESTLFNAETVNTVIAP